MLRFLAREGWDVTGFDVSQEAVRRANDTARRSRLSIHAMHSTSEAFDYGTDRWDLLVLCYAWAPVSNPAFVVRLKQSLKLGGLFVFEHYLHDGPTAAPKAAGAPDSAELAKLFSNFAILRYEELADVPDWEPPFGASKAPRLVRMIAKKPALASACSHILSCD